MKKHLATLYTDTGVRLASGLTGTASLGVLYASGAAWWQQWLVAGLLAGGMWQVLQREARQRMRATSVVSFSRIPKR